MMGVQGCYKSGVGNRGGVGCRKAGVGNPGWKACGGCPNCFITTVGGSDYQFQLAGAVWTILHVAGTLANSGGWTLTVNGSTFTAAASDCPPKDVGAWTKTSGTNTLTAISTTATNCQCCQCINITVNGTATYNFRSTNTADEYTENGGASCYLYFNPGDGLWYLNTPDNSYFTGGSGSCPPTDITKWTKVSGASTITAIACATGLDCGCPCGQSDPPSWPCKGLNQTYLLTFTYRSRHFSNGTCTDPPDYDCTQTKTFLMTWGVRDYHSNQLCHWYHDEADFSLGCAGGDDEQKWQAYLALNPTTKLWYAELDYNFRKPGIWNGGGAIPIPPAAARLSPVGAFPNTTTGCVSGAPGVSQIIDITEVSIS